MAVSKANEVYSVNGGYTEESFTIDYVMDCFQQRMASTTLNSFSSHVFYVANTGFFIQLRKDTAYLGTPVRHKVVHFYLAYDGGDIPDSISCVMTIAGSNIKLSFPHVPMINQEAKPKKKKKETKFNWARHLGLQEEKNLLDLPDNKLQLKCTVTVSKRTDTETKVVR